MGSKPITSIDGWQIGRGDPEENPELVVAFDRSIYSIELGTDGTMTVSWAYGQSMELPARAVDMLVAEYQEHLAWQECWECEGTGRLVGENMLGLEPGDDATCESCGGEGSVRARENQ